MWNRRPDLALIDLSRCLAQEDNLCRNDYLMGSVQGELQPANGWLGAIGNWM